jgi:hypothetical protein
VDKKMDNYDGVVALEVEQKKWGWHLLFDIFTTILALRPSPQPFIGHRAIMKP